MANNSLPPPWIKTKASRNVAKRARLGQILKRKAAEVRRAELAALKTDRAR